MRKRAWAGWWCLAVVSLVGGGAGCGGQRGEEPGDVSDGVIRVAVSLVPHRYIVERIGGAQVEIEVMVGRGESPAVYEPKPSQLVALAGADLYLAAGVPFELGWLDRFRQVNPRMVIVNLNDGLDLLPMAGHDHADHGPGGAHHPDPHTWLSPRLAREQAGRITTSLSRMAPAHADRFAANLADLEADIEDLDGELRALFVGTGGRSFLVFHPSWGYFAADYGLVQVPIEVGGQEPSPAELGRLIEEAAGQGIGVVFAQPEFRTEQARQVADSLGCELVLVSPLAPDWLENLRSVGTRMARALREEGSYE